MLQFDLFLIRIGFKLARMFVGFGLGSISFVSLILWIFLHCAGLMTLVVPYIEKMVVQSALLCVAC